MIIYEDNANLCTLYVKILIEKLEKKHYTKN